MNTTTKHTHNVLIAIIITVALAIGLAGVASQPASAYADAPQAKAGAWAKSGGKWWYKYTDGTYPANEQITIKGATYSFDAKGWMKTGWKLENGSWYYYKGSGAMATGWTKVKGTWYYLNADGKMATGWKQVDGEWYYLKDTGAMATGWLALGSDWYYLKGSGAMATGWQKVKGSWYLLGSDGKMLTGKQTVAGKTYILSPSGAMKTGWVEHGKVWYHTDKSGAVQTNEWVGNYFVGADGAMATSGWVDGGKYYVDASGKWVKNPVIQEQAKPQPSAPNTSPTEPSEAAHEHQWYENVERQKVIDEPGHTVWVCSCGEEFLSGTLCADHQEAATLLEIEQGINPSVEGKHGRSKTYTVKEQSHYEDVVVGYKCACGATK